MVDQSIFSPVHRGGLVDEVVGPSLAPAAAKLDVRDALERMRQERRNRSAAQSF
jgi:hypothetical protein